VGRHADGDAAGTVHQQVRDAGGQDGRLGGLAVVVRLEDDGVLADVADHLHRQRCEAALGITHCCSTVVTAGAEVTLPVDERVAHGPGLGHAHEGVVDRGVTVGVVVTHGLCHWLRGLDVSAFRPVAVVEHGVENAPVYRLHAIPNLREGTAHDH